MTSERAAAQYLAEHQAFYQGRPLAIHNPNDLPVQDLPVIFGYNSGPDTSHFLGGCIGISVAQDGTELALTHCSHEGYMLADLGILAGTRPQFHEDYRRHYPDGYRMQFVGHADVSKHAGLQAAFAKRHEKPPAA
jgi:hypothetical protein